MFEFNRQLIKYINSARSEPKNTGKSMLSHFQNSYHGSEMHAFGKIIDTFEGIQALQNLEEYLSYQEPTHSLIHSKALDQAAQVIAEKKGREGKTENQSPKFIYDTIQRFGSTDGKVGQLMSLCASTPNQISSYFLIDDGLASRKRRRMLLDPTYRYIGIGQAAHTQYQTITVIVLAQILKENDNYMLQNQRITSQIQRASQSQVSYPGSNPQRQSHMRQSQFY